MKVDNVEVYKLQKIQECEEQVKYSWNYPNVVGRDICIMNRIRSEWFNKSMNINGEKC